MNSHINTLGRKDRFSIRTTKSSNKYRFGDGTPQISKYNVVIPIYVGRCKYRLSVDVVNSNVPLLLSRETLTRANAKIDIGQVSMCFLGVTIPLSISSTGHLCLPISRPLDISNGETQKVLTRVLFSSPITGVGLDLKNKAKKLHLQFCHPTSDRLIDLVKKAGTDDQNVLDAIREVSSQCDVCIRNRKAPLRPAVGFPLATQFNQTVAMDLKSRGPNIYILHLIDHLTRYSMACVIYNKRKETIIKGIMDQWIKIFGCPKYFLTDNGGEFVNQDLIDMAEKFNIILKTTAAESAWSNGLCERHNGILNNNVNKVIESCGCSLDVAVAWAVSAKNTLANVYGFSPNTLVFGKNPNFPTAFVNKPPANNLTCLNDYVRDNLNAMHAARKEFIEQESSERLRRALNKKSRTYSNHVYCQGDRVYYWRNDQLNCHGPATVIGRDGQQILLKHGGMYIRVHPCRMQPCITETTSTSSSYEQSSQSNNNTSSVSSSEDNDNDYVTADEDDNDDNDRQSSNHSAESESSSTEVANLNNTTSTSEDNWINVLSSKDLPKVNSTVDCMFPDFDTKIRCKILSKAGKSTTANWHFMNIKEDDEDPGKCCSFKHAKWKATNDSEATSTETFFGQCNPMFDSAKNDEIQKWQLFETFIEVPDNGQKAISTRWVCTRKIKGGNVVHKARLVARGFEENSKLLQKDSPTCSKETLRIVLFMIASHSWKVHSIDIKSAFLQGAPLDRDVFIRPPKEANTKCLWKMKRCPYGLADAGRHWYLRLKETLLKAGMVVSKYDQALFLWYIDGQLSGILTCHVDDIILGGENQFHDHVIVQLRNTFTVGVEEDTNLKYLGLMVTQTDDGIKVSTDEYANSLKELTVPKVNSEHQKEFSSDHLKTLKQFCGQINWLTTQGRPDIAFDSCQIANSLKTGNHNVFYFANKIVRKIHNQIVNLNFPCGFDIKSCKVVSFCDASFANLPNAGSQGSFVTLLIDKNGMYCPIAWQSRKIRRVVKSTLAAEGLAAVEAAEITSYLAILLKEILQISGTIDALVYCDNQNLVNSVHSSTNLEDKRLLIDVSILRDMLQQHELTDFLWISTDNQLANVLTKQGASNKLLVNVFNNTNLRFCYETADFR